MGCGLCPLSGFRECVQPDCLAWGRRRAEIRLRGGAEVACIRVSPSLVGVYRCVNWNGSVSVETTGAVRQPHSDRHNERRAAPVHGRPRKGRMR